MSDKNNIGFSLTEDQLEDATIWDLLHNCSARDGGAIGGRLTYTFTHTGIGVIEKVVCACGEVLDLTDYESW